MTAEFVRAGYEVVPFGLPCDVGVIHSCTITAQAERTSVRAARSLKKLSPSPLVVVTGCAAEVHAQTLQEEEAIDLLAGQAEKSRLPELVQTQTGKHARRGTSVSLVSRTREATGKDAGATEKGRHRQDLPAVPQFHTTRALIKVQDGCDFRCAYCVVPSARGAPRSRPWSEILDEVQKLADGGYREIVLTGANLGCYRDGSRDLVDLVKAIELIPEVLRIRLSSIESTTVEHEIIDLMAASGKLCHYLHFPLQSGDDRVLSTMGRRYTARSFRELVEYAARRVSPLGLGTDILAGLPGEDERAFRNTVAMVRDLPFNNLHVFPYSPRPGTPAVDLPAQVATDVARRRVAEIIRIGEEKRADFARSFIGRGVSALIERIDSRGKGRGWTGEYLPIRVAGKAIAANNIVTFTPDSVHGDELHGRASGVGLQVSGKSFSSESSLTPCF